MERFDAFVDRLKPLLIRAFWFALAVIFLIESWIWDHVRDWLRQLERALGLERIEPWLAGVVEKLSPPMTLALFAVPMLGVLPFKVAALALLAKGHVFLGVLFIFLVKSLTLGVEAFLFDICRDKLLQMPWFARLYSIVLDARAWASLLVKPLKLRALKSVARLPAAATAFVRTNGGDVLRWVAQLRDMMRQKPRA
jgi:hypothetical protein